MLDVQPIPAFNDNYLWLIRAPADPTRAVVVDPGDAEPVLATLARESLTLAAILVTHHHGDHIGGVRQLLSDFDVPVFGPKKESIPGLTHALADGDRVELAELGLHFDVLDVPGHTAGHIAYYWTDSGHSAVFCGDTLFCAGCGRLFEGTPAQMNHSLGRLADLPGETQVFCTHEYTLDNLRFATAVEPENEEMTRFRASAVALREKGLPTLPSTIERERRINPFMRCGLESIREAASRHVNRTVADPVEVFAIIRHWKDGLAG